MFDWYLDLHWLPRLLAALAVLGLCAVVFFVYNRVWPWGIAIGIIMLLAAIPFDKENKWGDW